ncbi:WD repeat-containing protein 18 [Morus notabilis]|uniref:WD repeat-containing protein 18 n=1 Tax=Morus notabilis TaxID=981085 RepID=W9R5L9_9ROSA|nr:protein ROOT INITIATION DEFECTIVE 3 [Morus notabilis]EXB71793.1 WD repeat-containing protein 18 [Morus notabilis]
MEVVVASSSVDAGIGCWDLQSGAEQLRYKSCASPRHGLVCVGRRFLASSQLRNSSASSGSVLYWTWSKPQVEVKSFPAEQIKPLAANREGTYIVGGGLSGDIYLWEVASGSLLKNWHAHYRAVTCLVFSDDDSLLISGSEDGSVKVWSLLMIFDDYLREQASHPYVHSFSEHTLCITDIIAGYGGCNAIIVSASEDRTCKVWSLSKGKLLRNIVFPSIIDAIALDPSERVFYAGGRDGKIYVAALNAEIPSSKKYGLHIISAFSNHSKAVTCLQYGTTGNVLISGSEDGMIRVWDARTYNIIRVLRHAKGPVNNIILVREQLKNFQRISNSQAFLRKHASLLPPLEKYANSTDDVTETKTVIGFQETCNKSIDAMYLSSVVAHNQIKELQQRGSAAVDMELDRVKLDCKKSMQMVEQWKKMYENLHQFCVDELLEDGK